MSRTAFFRLPTFTQPRWLGAIWFVVISAPLLIASALKPSPTGHGTHQQLGLPPCSSIVLLGIRCPACGMTTSWAHFTQGQWLASFRANCGGFLLAILACSTLILAARVILTNRPPRHGTVTRHSWIMIGIAVVTMVDWLVRLS